jgi:hypothetical protein
MADRRPAAITALLGLVAGALAFAAAPFDMAAVRLAGIGLLWWYAALLAPATAAVVTALVLLADRRR